jgi:transposase
VCCKVPTKVQKQGGFNRKAGTGASRKTTGREDRQLVRLTKSNRWLSSKQLQVLWNEASSVDVSASTVRRRLNEKGFSAKIPVKKPLLNLRQRKARVDWAKAHKDWTAEQWRMVIFSDESKFNVISSNGSRRVWRKPSEHYSNDCVLPTVKHSAYIMVWSCMSCRGLGPLYVVQNTMRKEQCIKVLDNELVPYIHQYFPEEDVIYQDDSAPCHRAKIVTEWYEVNGIRHLP